MDSIPARVCWNGDLFLVCYKIFRETKTVNSFVILSEIKCAAYTKFPPGVVGGSSDPCKPASDFRLSTVSDTSCNLRCAFGFEQKGGGTGESTLKCGVDGKLVGDLECIEIKCPAYTKFNTGVEGGSSDPCKPAPDFHLKASGLSYSYDSSCSTNQFLVFGLTLQIQRAHSNAKLATSKWEAVALRL